MLARSTAVAIVIVFCSLDIRRWNKVHVDVKQPKWWCIAYIFHKCWLTTILKHPCTSINSVYILFLGLPLFEVRNTLTFSAFLAGIWCELHQFELFISTSKDIQEVKDIGLKLNFFWWMWCQIWLSRSFRKMLILKKCQRF